jgi:integrase
MKISKRKDGRFGTQIHIPDGKYKTVYGKTSKECRQKAYDLVAQIEDGTYVKADKTLFKHWVEDWKKGYLVGIKETTKKSYISHLNTHIIPAFGNKQIQSIEQSDIQKFCTSLFKDKGLSQKMVRNIHGTLHKCLDDAISAKLIRINPATGITLPKKIKPKITPLTEDELSKFYKAAENDRYASIFTFLILTGLRISELTGLTFDRVDFSNKTILIDRQLVSAYPVKFGTPKHDKIRTVSLPTSAIRIIKSERSDQARLKLLIGDPDYNKHSLVFCGDDGSPINGHGVYKHLKTVSAQIGFPGLRVHDLRHTYAVLSLQAGVDVKTVQENLGHHTAAFTLDQYGFVTAGMRSTGADKLEKYVNSYVK